MHDPKMLIYFVSLGEKTLPDRDLAKITAKLAHFAPLVETVKQKLRTFGRLKCT